MGKAVKCLIVLFGLVSVGLGFEVASDASSGHLPEVIIAVVLMIVALALQNTRHGFPPKPMRWH